LSEIDREGPRVTEIWGHRPRKDIL